MYLEHDNVSHWNWVLLEGGGELVDRGVDTKSGVDEGGGGVPEGKLTKVSLIQKSMGRNQQGTGFPGHHHPKFGNVT